MKIIVGGKAANHWLPNFRTNDTDVWSTDIVDGCDSVVFEQQILDLFEDESKNGYATLNDLMTIKLSHLPYDIFWHKHLNDYLLFKSKGATINHPLYESLKDHWKKEHGNKDFLTFYRTKDSFFDDHVVKEQDHDYLHTLVAHPNNPVYTECLMDGQEVMIDKNKFDSLSFEKQVQMFREEINVIATERWLIPTRDSGRISFMDAYKRSVHKTVTALTKGWASTFICENIECFMKPKRSEVVYMFGVLGINV